MAGVWLVCNSALSLPAQDSKTALKTGQVYQSPFADPILRADAVFKARKAVTWRQGQTRFILLENDGSIELGSYGFGASRAVVRIDTQHLPGKTISHLSMYLLDARPIAGRGSIQAQAGKLLVTASTTGNLTLEANLVEHQNHPPIDPLVDQAAGRVARYRSALASGVSHRVLTPKMAVAPAQVQESKRNTPAALETDTSDGLTVDVTPPGTGVGSDDMHEEGSHEDLHEDTASDSHADVQVAGGEPSTPAVSAASSPMLGGTFIYHYDTAVVDYDDDPIKIMVFGNVNIAYQQKGGGVGGTGGPGGPGGKSQDFTMTLSCENAVIFVDAHAGVKTGGQRLNPNDIQGIYLEDNVVITDGKYTIRAPRVFYDPSTQRAIVLDAVFYTWDVNRKIPIYVRAQKLRQHSLASWSGEQVTLSNSEFAEPHFSIAMDRLSMQMRPDDQGRSLMRVKTGKITPQFGSLRLGSFPGYQGDVKDIPLRAIDVRSDSKTGFQVRTTWDGFAVLGLEQPEGVDMKLRLDYIGEHGPAVGMDLKYDQPQRFGAFRSYLLGKDDGEDEFGGRKIEHQDEVRGFVRLQHRERLANNWSLSLEGAYVSDPTFLEEFYRREADTAKPYETSLYLKHQQADQQFGFLAMYDLINFTPQTTVLLSPGYTVEKLPELAYHRVGTSILGDKLTYYTENRLTRMRVRAGRDSPKDRGFSVRDSFFNFGGGRLGPIIPPSKATLSNEVEFDTAISGFPGDRVLRLDSRHEVQLPSKIGDIDVVPYAVGRVTLYDDNFEEFAGNDDKLRLWGMVGARFHTSISKTDNTVENQMFDLHQLRHIIEPEVDVFLAASTIDTADLPVYDPDVEGLQEGGGVRLGLRNTFQTQRGGPGRWRRVDWLVINTDLVLRTDDVQRAPEPARYFSYRPEYGQGGDHFYSDLAWMLSDTLSVTGDMTYNLETDQMDQWHGGLALGHRGALSAYIEYESLDIASPTGALGLKNTLLSAGFRYQLTRKYKLGMDQRWDLEENNSRRTSVIVERKLPRWTLLFAATVDDIDDRTSVGVLLIPDGMKTSRRLRP